MKYNITEYDKTLILQKSVDYKYRIFVVNNHKNILDELNFINSIGTYTIDAESNIRRTASFVIYLDNCYSAHSIEQKLYEWIGYSFKLQIAIYSLRDQAYIWYDCGYYMITGANTSYDAANNSITTTLSDWYARLNGTRNGQIGGAPDIVIPNKDANGNPITIKQATERILKSETDIADYIVDDIGQFYGMPQNNPDYAQYRKNNPLWNQLPYDLEYEAGCTIGDIFAEIKDLYPNCQMYFDIYGNFCFNMIPSCEYDPVAMDDSFIQKVLLSDDSENVSYDLESIKNVTEVFGQTYDVDRYCEACTTSSNIYTLSLEEYESYSSGDLIAFIPNANNIANMKLRINALDPLPLYYEYTADYIAAQLLEAGKTYVIEIKKVNGVYAAYYLGQYQPHALCVLTNRADDPVYTKAYFSAKYNCNENNIILRVEEDSPFAIQKLGEILDIKSGDDFDNIISDSVALENAVYYNRKSSSINETITISTKMIPFLDVNLKLEYKKQKEDKSKQYIIKSISNNTDSITSQISMMRFYPLYYI